MTCNVENVVNVEIIDPLVQRRMPRVDKTIQESELFETSIPGGEGRGNFQPQLCQTMIITLIK